MVKKIIDEDGNEFRPQMGGCMCGDSLINILYDNMQKNEERQYKV